MRSLPQLGGVIQAPQEGEFLFLGQVNQVVGRKGGLDGLLIQATPRSPKQARAAGGSAAGAARGRPGPASPARPAPARSQAVGAPRLGDQTRHQGQNHRRQGPG